MDHQPSSIRISPDQLQNELESIRSLRRISLSQPSSDLDPDLPNSLQIDPSSIQSCTDQSQRTQPQPDPNSDQDQPHPDLFWLPGLHPEKAPQEIKAFIEEATKPENLLCRTSSALGSLRLNNITPKVGFYELLQNIIISLFAKPLPASTTQDPLANPLGRVAIIGAGVTGISTAAHFLTHGFEVVLFEQSDSIGGIWARVNSTSSLQLDSLMYRFHPSVKWSNHFSVKRDEILNQVHKVWDHYNLTSRTRLNVTVNHVHPVQTGHQSTQWAVNGGVDGIFDAVVVAAGTCGPPRRISFPGRDSFTGKMVHSSELDQVDWEAKRVVVIGGGASAVEALELAVDSGCASPAVLVTRTDKWFIPRNLIFGILLASNSLGVSTFFDKIAEKLIRTFHYGYDLEWMSPTPYDGKPAAPLYSKTPIVNGEFLQLVRDKRADYVRAKIDTISPDGIEVQRFGSRGSQLIEADVIVEATGYHRPNLNFLPTEKLCRGPKGPDQYAPPNLFLQNFLANDWSCLMTNTGYYEGIGTVGHYHIGILARMMMMFLLDQQTAPDPTEMRRWVDRVVERKGTLTFFTYSELSLWLFVFLVSNPYRWSWLVFVGTGWGGVGTRKVKTI